MIPISHRPKIIWGAEAIAHKIGTSADFVRDRLAKEPCSPVKRVSGRYCAIESELFDYFRTKPAQPNVS